MHKLPTLLSALNDFATRNPFPPTPKELYEPCDYMLSLGGKRLRPALLLMGYNLFRDDVEQALPAAWAVELFHNFTLMHDDIMDAAPLRRGKPTVHTRWNANTGILSGDVMLIQAYRFLGATDSAVATTLIHEFSVMATEVCEGQQMDMNFETREQVSVEEYIRMIELKTAVLLGYALMAGAVCARAERPAPEKLYQVGRLAGIAFQVQDDLLDTYGDPAKFGKQVGGDILQNKKTLLVLKTLEVASEPDRRELLQWMQAGAENPTQKVAAVRAIFDRNNIPALIKAAKKQYQEKAFEYLDDVSVPNERKTVLLDTLADLLEREW
ncbi:MAG: polyprenyl synthetase family protein [Saprospiraceae bacterium]|nr:polyprenyl synthetase family protein [Saprospiraceae bacterium]